MANVRQLRTRGIQRLELDHEASELDVSRDQASPSACLRECGGRAPSP